MGSQRRRGTVHGDPAPTVADLYPRTVLRLEADAYRPALDDRVSWNGFTGTVVSVDGRTVGVRFDEPLYEGADPVVPIAVERLRSMDGERPPAPIKGMTIDAGKAALAAAAKELALSIHRKITQVEGLKADYRNMVRVCELLGVPLAELPAPPAGRQWTAEQRKAQSDRLRASNREGRTGRGKVKV